jgi:hypothetical protein
MRQYAIILQRPSASFHSRLKLISSHPPPATNSSYGRPISNTSRVWKPKIQLAIPGTNTDISNRLANRLTETISNLRILLEMRCLENANRLYIVCFRGAQFGWQNRALFAASNPLRAQGTL